MNKSGVWKSLELKAEEMKEVKKNDSRTSTKDSSPDTGIVIKVSSKLFFFTLSCIYKYFLFRLTTRRLEPKLRLEMKRKERVLSLQK